MPRTVDAPADNALNDFGVFLVPFFLGYAWPVCMAVAFVMLSCNVLVEEMAEKQFNGIRVMMLFLRLLPFVAWGMWCVYSDNVGRPNAMVQAFAGGLLGIFWFLSK